MATRRAEPALKAAQLEPASPQPRTMGPPASRAVMTSSKTSNAAKAGRSKGKAKSNHLEDVLVKRESHLARGLEEARERERQRLKDLEEAARLSREERIRKIQDKMVPRFMRATQASKAKDLTGLGQAPLPKVELPPEPIKPKPRPDVWKGQGLGDVLVPHRSKLETEIAKARAQAAAKAAGSDADADADAAAQAEAEAEAEAEAAAAAAAAAASGKAPDNAPRRMPRYMRPTQAFESFVGKTATTTSSDKSVSADAQPINSSTSTSASSPEPAAPESTVEEAAGKEAGLKLEEEGLDAAENDEQADPNCGVNAPGEDEESNKGFVSRAALKHQEAWGEGGLGDVLVKHKSRLQREQEAWYASQLADTHRPVPDNVSADPAAAGATAATTDEPAANGSSTGDAQA